MLLLVLHIQRTGDVRDTRSAVNAGTIADAMYCMEWWTCRGIVWCEAGEWQYHLPSWFPIRLLTSSSIKATTFLLRMTSFNTTTLWDLLVAPNRTRLSTPRNSTTIGAMKSHIPNDESSSALVSNRFVNEELTCLINSEVEATATTHSVDRFSSDPTCLIHWFIVAAREGSLFAEVEAIATGNNTLVNRASWNNTPYAASQPWLDNVERGGWLREPRGGVRGVITSASGRRRMASSLCCW